MLLTASLATIVAFYRTRPLAGLLMMPYLGWTCFATTLINCSLLYSNPAMLSDAERIVQVGSNLSAHRQLAACLAAGRVQIHKRQTEGIGAILLSQLHTWAAKLLSSCWHPATDCTCIQVGETYPGQSHLLTAILGALMVDGAKVQACPSAMQIKPQQPTLKNRRNATCPEYLSEFAKDVTPASDQPPAGLLKSVKVAPQWDQQHQGADKVSLCSSAAARPAGSLSALPFLPTARPFQVVKQPLASDSSSSKQQNVMHEVRYVGSEAEERFES